MRSIEPIPHDDQATLERICKDRPGWSAHKDAWVQAIAVYRLSGGDPWTIGRSAFPQEIKDAMEALYESRRKSGHIKRIRDYPFSGSCPFCGSLGIGSVDHFLPKDVFPEFSIYSLNLIPACSFCNSDEKGTIYMGDNPPTRFIHPYFDKIGDKAILSVAFASPYDAVEFSAVPAPGLVGDELEIVRFHISKLLGDAFERHIGNLWSKLPRLVTAYGGQSLRVTQATVQACVQWEFTSSQISTGLNSWTTGFYRGVLSDPGVIDYVAQKATEDLAQVGVPPSP